MRTLVARRFRRFAAAGVASVALVVMLAPAGIRGEPAISRPFARRSTGALSSGGAMFDPRDPARQSVPTPTPAPAAPSSNTSAAAPTGTEQPLTPLEIFERAKALFRAVKRPPYVVYTLHRRDTVDGMLDFLSTYTMRVWCRTADDAALSRRMWRGKAYGDLEFIRPTFNAPLDPGPPTADIFQRAPPGSRTGSSEPQPEPTATLPTLVRVTVRGELDYRVTLAGVERDQYHLRLTALRDPDRNRLRELWIDRPTFEVRRLVANDTLFYVGTGLTRPEIFDVTLSDQDGIPLIRTIHAATAFGLDPSGMNEREEGDYTFDDVSFPPSLAAWYFDPKLYGDHFADAPSA